MEAHIFLGCWFFFFCRKNALRILTSRMRSTPCACCAEPGSSSASAAPLRRCCWRRRWGLCLGLRPGLGGWWEELAESKALRISRNFALWKLREDRWSTIFFLVELFNFGGVLSLKMNGTHLHEGFENDVPLQMGEIWNISFQPFIFWGVRPPWN